MTSNQRVSTQITQIRQALYLARSLAVTQGQIWKVCLMDVSNSCVKESGESLESGNFQVCSSDLSNPYGRQVIVYRSGRVRLSVDADNDGYHESSNGTVNCD